MSEVAAFKDVASLAYMNALTDKEKGQVGIYNVTIDDIIEELTKSYNITTIETGTVELATSDEDTNIELLAGETINKRVITSKDSTTNYVELKGKYYKFYLKNGKIEVDEGLKERPNATNDYSFTATSSDESLAKVTVTPESTSNFTIQISGEGETTSSNPAIITVSYGGSSVQINVTVKACNLLVTSESVTKGNVAVTSNPGAIGTNKYKKGTSVTLEATSNTGYIFGGWYRVTGENENITENLISSENPYTFTIENENDTIKAKYNEATLIQGFVDDLGTRAMIYLYANPYANEARDTITIKDAANNNLVDVDGTSITTIRAVAKNTNADGKFEIIENDGFKHYVAYPVTKNGEYTFYATKTKNGVTLNSTITVSVENIEKFTAIEALATSQNLISLDNGQKSYNYKGAVVPKGYYIDTNSNVDTGLVITDGIDENGYSTGNEWVWVPVNSSVGNDEFYANDITGTMAGYDTDTKTLKYNKYSLLYGFGTDETTKTTTRSQMSVVTPNSTSGHREIGIIYDTKSGEKANLTSNPIYSRATAKNSSPTALTSEKAIAEQYIADYCSMVESITAYGGFYIGRYELTVDGEKPGKPLYTPYNGSGNFNWYKFYNQCMMLNKENTETSMIYGTLWDATMQWLNKSGYIVGCGSLTSGYGNYKKEKITASNDVTSIVTKPVDATLILQTGQASYTKSNNIYDLAGNREEYTQEVDDWFRVIRGGSSGNYVKWYTYAASRFTCDPTIVNGHTSRAQLYIK